MVMFMFLYVFSIKSFVFCVYKTLWWMKYWLILIYLHSFFFSILFSFIFIIICLYFKCYYYYNLYGPKLFTWFHAALLTFAFVTFILYTWDLWVLRIFFFRNVYFNLCWQAKVWGLIDCWFWIIKLTDHLDSFKHIF